MHLINLALLLACSAAAFPSSSLHRRADAVAVPDTKANQEAADRKAWQQSVTDKPANKLPACAPDTPLTDAEKKQFAAKTKSFKNVDKEPRVLGDYVIFKPVDDYLQGEQISLSYAWNRKKNEVFVYRWVEFAEVSGDLEGRAAIFNDVAMLKRLAPTKHVVNVVDACISTEKSRYGIVYERQSYVSVSWPFFGNECGATEVKVDFVKKLATAVKGLNDAGVALRTYSDEETLFVPDGKGDYRLLLSDLQDAVDAKDRHAARFSGKYWVAPEWKTPLKAGEQRDLIKADAYMLGDIAFSQLTQRSVPFTDKAETTIDLKAVEATFKDKLAPLGVVVAKLLNPNPAQRGDAASLIDALSKVQASLTDTRTKVAACMKNFAS